MFGLPALVDHATDELTGDDFATHMRENPVTAVLFYAPWCFYSQQMMPTWDLAAQKLQIHDPPVKLVKIDVQRYSAVGREHGINAFPTMKLFIDGKEFEYDASQGRQWQSIVKWVNKHTDRDHVLKDENDAEAFLHDNDLNVVGLFPDDYDSSFFVKSTRHYEDIMFAEARGSNISAKIAGHISKHASLVCETVLVGKSSENKHTVELPRDGMHCADHPRNPQRPEWTDKFEILVDGKSVNVRRVDSPAGWLQNMQLKCCDQEVKDPEGKYMVPVPGIAMFMPHDERFAVYDGALPSGGGDHANLHELDRWLQARRTPMVMQLNEDTVESIFASDPEKTPTLFLVTKAKEEGLVSVLREAAKSLRGRVKICTSGAQSQLERRLMEVVGADEDQLPLLALVEGGHAGPREHLNAKKYRLKVDGVEAQQIVDFITDFEAGKLKPWLKSESEPSPEDNMGPVGVLVGSTFVDVVHDDQTDVLVDFYAPWCGHCRKFEPIYKDLAKRLQHVKSIKITKIDSTRNEVDELRISAFPTLVLFPAGKTEKDKIMYQGNRQVEDMVRWLHGHCHNKFDDTPPKTVAPVNEESGLLDPSEEDL